MRITAAVCTYNRADVLEATIDSLLAQRPAGEPLDILVVDNASTDRTPEILAAYAAREPAVRAVVEQAQGHSRARNRAIEEALGDVVAFLDDDVVVDPGWAEAIAALFASDPGVGAMAGRIDLLYEAPRPAWMPAGFENLYSGLDLGDAPVDLGAPDHPVGANFAVRTDVARSLGGFDPRVGRVRGNLLSADEVEFFQRFRGLGLRIRYEPAALVAHRVPPARVQRRWLLRRAWYQGRGETIVKVIHADPAAIPRLRVRRAIGGSLRALLYGARAATLRPAPDGSKGPLFWSLSAVWHAGAGAQALLGTGAKQE